MSTPNPLSPACVVVAFSPDDYGRAALKHGAALASTAGGRLVVVNDSRGDSYVDRRFAQDDEIATLQVQLTADGLDVEVRHEVVPNVADAVLDAAEQSGADLLVVGVRHRNPVGKLIMGSIAQRVILEAPCPVLAVKPPR
jgi:nucleotide-binding universal stress UspA family protein